MKATHSGQVRRLGGRWFSLMGLTAGMLAVMAPSCSPAVGNGTPNGAPVTPSYDRAVITYDKGTSAGVSKGSQKKGYRFDDDYTVRSSGSTLTVYAPVANGGGNFREALLPSKGMNTQDQEACVTWHGVTKAGPMTNPSQAAMSKVQPGIVLRSYVDGNVTRSIMITNNIAGYRNVLNVHLTDTSSAKPYEQIDQLSGMGSIHDYISVAPLPWRICARVVGYKVSYKAWSIGKMAEPSWDDPRNAQTTDIRFNYMDTRRGIGGTKRSGGKNLLNKGRAGVFVGHLTRGEETKYSDLVVKDLSAAK